MKKSVDHSATVKRDKRAFVYVRSIFSTSAFGCIRHIAFPMSIMKCDFDKRTVFNIYLDGKEQKMLMAVEGEKQRNALSFPQHAVI